MVWKSFIPWVCPAGHQREVPGLCAEEASLYHCQYEPTLAPSISFQLWLLLYSIHRSNRFKDATASLALFLDIRWWVGSKLNDISMKWQRRTIKWGLQSRKMKKDLGISKKKKGVGVKSALFQVMIQSVQKCKKKIFPKTFKSIPLSP